MDTRREQFRFDGFELQPDERLLLAHGAPVAIAPRAFDLLVALVTRGGRLVSKDDLLDAVWPRLVVEESNLQVHVSSLRKILGRDAIETTPGRGYRFVPVVRRLVVDRRSPFAPDGNLPPPGNSFVAPPGQPDTCRRLLERTRLLTLTGVPGVGKSRLLRETASACRGGFPDGVWLVDVAHLDSAEALPRALAAALRIAAVNGGSVHDALARHVEARAMLLLLDNCEPHVQACAELAKRLLLASAQLRVIASSREALRVTGEITVAVPPLPVPPAPAPPDELVRFAAVRLFMERALAEHPAFLLTAGNAAAIAQICRRVDGLPLAIELVAPLVRQMTPQTIAERLRDSPLDVGITVDDARHRTLWSALHESFRLLSEREQEVLLRLSVFTGGWTVAAAQCVCPDDAATADDVLECLASLVGKSFVAFQPERQRYSMLPIVRRYLQDRLGDDPAQDALRQRHRAWRAKTPTSNAREPAR